MTCWSMVVHWIKSTVSIMSHIFGIWTCDAQGYWSNLALSPLFSFNTCLSIVFPLASAHCKDFFFNYWLCASHSTALYFIFRSLWVQLLIEMSFANLSLHSDYTSIFTSLWYLHKNFDCLSWWTHSMIWFDLHLDQKRGKQLSFLINNNERLHILPYFRSEFIISIFLLFRVS
jgi:hypothetical protein